MNINRLVFSIFILFNQKNVKYAITTTIKLNKRIILKDKLQESQ